MFIQMRKTSTNYKDDFMSGKEDFTNMFGDLLGGITGESAHIGKKVMAHDGAWIVVGKVNATLWLAVRAGTTMPTQVHVIKADQSDFIE